HIHYRLAYLHRKVELGPGKALGRILVEDLAFRHRLGELTDEVGSRYRDADDARLVEAEYDAALQGRGRIVEVHDGAAGAADRREAALDQFGPGLGEHLDSHVIGNQVLLDQLADETKIGFRRCGKPDFDLLEAEPYQQLEHPAFAIRSHRLDQCLIAVAQI